MSGCTTASDITGRPRLLGRLIGSVGRGLIVLTGLLLAAVVVAAPASAYWHAAGSGTGRATTATLAGPTGVTVPANSASSVSVSWTASGGSPVPTGYDVTRTGGGTVAACGTSAIVLIAGTSCTDTAVPNGTYTYVVTAVYRSWDAASAASGTVTVASATKLAFTTQPGTVVATAVITPPVAVTVETAAGTAVPVANVSVTVAIGTNPGGGTLSGTRTALTDASGVATFGGLSIDKVGVGYTLTATSTGLASATSAAFTVSVGPAAKLAVTTSPGDSFAGGVFYTQPVVTIQDAGNNMVSTSTSAVTLTITTANGATLSCGVQSAVAGVATFSGCSINTVGSYTLTATSGSLTAATSTAFAVVAAPTHLAWSGATTTVCGPASGTSFALSYTGCTVFVVSVGSFTATVALTDANGAALTNLGTAVTVMLTPTHGTVNPQTLTIAHGQSVSSTTSTFSPQYTPLFVTVDQVTASASSLTSAVAVLHS